MTGSIPVHSIPVLFALLAELVDALVLGTSVLVAWEFESPGGHRAVSRTPGTVSTPLLLAQKAL